MLIQAGKSTVLARKGENSLLHTEKHINDTCCAPEASQALRSTGTNGESRAFAVIRGFRAAQIEALRVFGPSCFRGRGTESVPPGHGG